MEDGHAKYKIKYITLRNRTASMTIGSLHSLMRIYEDAISKQAQNDMDTFNGWLEHEVRNVRILNDSQSLRLDEAIRCMEEALKVGEKRFEADQVSAPKFIRSQLLTAQNELTRVLNENYPGTLVGYAIFDLECQIYELKNGNPDAAITSAIRGVMEKLVGDCPKVQDARQTLSQINESTNPNQTLTLLEQAGRSLSEADLAKMK